ncbi:MAG: hypothetical protein CMG04_06735 [Candidatus Marinimicrobia bacterium]|nr:hypothetical protein [Candidatus Neomarinimicrobiota bacterium]|tara:strand:- start:4145 stop:4429 length:285 start_codon:yes stop_codon:yes gene_type:complete
MSDTKRKLAAIVFTDIVGFTELSSRNEPAALKLLEKQRELLEPIWKILGDGCHLTRDIRGILSEAGFKTKNTKDMYIPGTPKFIGYHIWGLINK